MTWWKLILIIGLTYFGILVPIAVMIARSAAILHERPKHDEHEDGLPL